MKKIEPPGVWRIAPTRFPGMSKIRTVLTSWLNFLEKEKELISKKLLANFKYSSNFYLITMVARRMEISETRMMRKAEKDIIEACEDDDRVKNFFYYYEKRGKPVGLLTETTFPARELGLRLTMGIKKWSLENLPLIYARIRSLDGSSFPQKYVEKINSLNKNLQEARKWQNKLLKLVREYGSVLDKKIPVVDDDEFQKELIKILEARRWASKSPVYTNVIEKAKRKELTLYELYMNITEDVETFLNNVERHQREIKLHGQHIKQYKKVVSEIEQRMKKTLERRKKEGKVV